MKKAPYLYKDAPGIKFFMPKLFVNLLSITIIYISTKNIPVKRIAIAIAIAYQGLFRVCFRSVFSRSVFFQIFFKILLAYGCAVMAATLI